MNPRASKLHSAERRARIVHDVTAAVRHLTGSRPWVEDGSLEAMRATLASATEAPLVVVIGGDGTVREAAAALVGRQAPLAIVPAGTGNVLAAAVGVRGIGPGLEAIRHGRVRRLDLGLARWWPVVDDPAVAAPMLERIFTVACGMGLDARIMAAAEQEWKRRLQFGAYVGAAFRELVRLTSSRFRIVADGEAIEIEGYLVLVANAGQLVPGRIGPRQPIDPSSGRLELIVLGGTDPFAALHGGLEADAPVRQPLRERRPALGQRGHGRGGSGTADRDRWRPPRAGSPRGARHAPGDLDPGTGQLTGGAPSSAGPDC